MEMRKLSASCKWKSEILQQCQQGVLRDVESTRREGDQKLAGDGRGMQTASPRWDEEY